MCNQGSPPPPPPAANGTQGIADPMNAGKGPGPKGNATNAGVASPSNAPPPPPPKASNAGAAQGLVSYTSSCTQANMEALIPCHFLRSTFSLFSLSVYIYVFSPCANNSSSQSDLLGALQGVNEAGKQPSNAAPEAKKYEAAAMQPVHLAGKD